MDMKDKPKKLIEGFADLEQNEDGTVSVHFGPGCFDDFEGTQEELDEAIKQITAMFQDTSIEDLEVDAVDIEDLTETDPKLAERLLQRFITLDDEGLNGPRRSLQ